MQLAAYIGLLFALLTTMFVAGYACFAAWRENENGLGILEKGQMVSAALVLFSSAVLSAALVARDYSFVYVFENVDNTLSLMYRLTAFWAGRTGSLLFWQLIMSVAGAVFVVTRGYERLGPKTKLLFWVFFLSIQAFFLLLLTCWSNPFIQAVPTPADGLGLNPLLQNPGMVFHPPLLFFGYGLFAIPASAALAALLSGERSPWIKVCRTWNLLAWAFLTAGIILGAWWSYMELGWGGYWAWDPVENASLIPWFSGTAFLHTAVIEAKRGALKRFNVFLMALTFLLCVFGTYLVRSGVEVNSLHTFGGSGVALPLIIFMLGGLGVTLMAVFLGDPGEQRPLVGLASRQGVLLMVTWVLLALGLTVGVGTMWPVIVKLWSNQPVALEPSFYNRVCLPFLTLTMLLFCICPWLGWKEGVRNVTGASVTAGVFVGSAVILWFMGVQIPLALIAASGAIASIVSIVMLFVTDKAVRGHRRTAGAYVIHLGLAMMVLGVAFSGPYKSEGSGRLGPGQSMQVEEYVFTNQGLEQIMDGAVTVFAADIEVQKRGKVIGMLGPERRFYPNSQNAFAEVSVIPSFGDELYATLADFDMNTKTVTLTASVNPLVNWLWIGGTLMCLAPLFIFERRED